MNAEASKRLLELVRDGTPPYHDPRQPEGSAESLWRLIRTDAEAARAEDSAIIRDRDNGLAGRWSSRWPAIDQRLVGAFTDGARDLGMAVVLIESSTATDGIAGLRNGLAVYEQIARSCWEDATPLRDDPDDGDELRVRPLAELTADMDRGAGVLVRRATLTRLPDQSASGAVRALCWYDCEDRSAKLSSTDDVDFTPPEFAEYLRHDAALDELRATLQAATSSVTLLDSLHEVLRGVCLPEGDKRSTVPPVSGLRNALVRVVRKCEAHLPTESSTAEAEETDAAHGIVGGASVQGHEAGPMTRARALATLEQIARYFECNEPHSFVPYGVRRAIRWAQMPFHEVISEVIQDNNVVADISRVAGLPSPKERNRSDVQ